MKYKVGDVVRIREWDDMENEFGLDCDGAIKCQGSFVISMKEFCGGEHYRHNYLLKR